MNTRAAGRGTTTAGIAATTDAVTTVAAAGERGRQGTTRGVIYQPGSTLTKFGTFPENRTTSVSRSLTGSSTVPFHRGGRCFVRLPVSRSLTGSSTVPVHRKGGSRQRMSGPSTMSHPAMWTCPACGRPLTVALNPEGGEAGAHRPLEISRASAAAHACAPAARFPQFHNASSSSITGYEPASCQPWQPPVSAGAEDDEGVISQSEYTLTKPSSCPNHRDHVTRPQHERQSHAWYRRRCGRATRRRARRRPGLSIAVRRRRWSLRCSRAVHSASTSRPKRGCCSCCRSKGLTREGRRLAAVMALVIVFWITEVLPLEVTALLSPMLAIMFEVRTGTQVLAPFANPLIFPLSRQRHPRPGAVRAPRQRAHRLRGAVAALRRRPPHPHPARLGHARRVPLGVD